MIPCDGIVVVDGNGDRQGGLTPSDSACRGADLMDCGRRLCGPHRGENGHHAKEKQTNRRHDRLFEDAHDRVLPVLFTGWRVEKNIAVKQCFGAKFPAQSI